MDCSTNPFYIVDKQSDFVALRAQMCDITSLNTECLMNMVTEPMEDLSYVGRNVHLRLCAVEAADRQMEKVFSILFFLAAAAVWLRLLLCWILSFSAVAPKDRAAFQPCSRHNTS
jgi:hypothetical protein